MEIVFIVVRMKSWHGSELTDIVSVHKSAVPARAAVDLGNAQQKQQYGDWPGQWYYGIKEMPVSP